jgi:hypothetical protein
MRWPLFRVRVIIALFQVVVFSLRQPASVFLYRRDLR